MKCKQGHEMLKGANGHHVKHCGECGSGPAAVLDMVKCSTATCGATFAKAEAPKFCLECGDKIGDAVPAFEAELEQLNAYAKARVAIEKDLETLPTVEDDAVDVASIETLIKSASFETAEGAKGVDATPLVAEMLKAIGHVQLENRVVAEHQTKWAKHLADGVGRMVGTIAALGAMVKAQGEKIEELGSRSRGRRAIADLTVFPVPHAAQEETIAKGSGYPDLPDLDGVSLMAKAQVAMSKKPGVLSLDEIAQLETYCGSGAGLHAIAGNSPALALKCVQVIEIADGAAH